MELNQSPVEHGFTPEQEAIISTLKSIYSTTLPEDAIPRWREKRTFAVTLVGFKEPEQWTTEEWEMLATQLEMPLSFYR